MLFGNTAPRSLSPRDSTAVFEPALRIGCPSDDPEIWPTVDGAEGLVAPAIAFKPKIYSVGGS